MIAVIWMEIPDAVVHNKVVSDKEPQTTGPLPVLNDDDECVGLVFTGLPPNVKLTGHLDIDEQGIDCPIFLRLNTDENGIAHISFQRSTG